MGEEWELLDTDLKVYSIGARCFGGFVSEGYGMTETSCLVAGSQEDDKTSGHVGPPTPACGKKKTFQKNQCHLCFQISHASTHSLNHN
jgi:acyl-CoA synthetase (AMP-forming)/AMP-acid ligase II